VGSDTVQFIAWDGTPASLKDAARAPRPQLGGSRVLSYPCALAQVRLRRVGCPARPPPPLFRRSYAHPLAPRLAPPPFTGTPSFFLLTRRSHSISFTRAQGIPEYIIGSGGGKDGIAPLMRAP
jgi:hypothetical protein